MSNKNLKAPMPSKMSNYIDRIVQLLKDKYGYADKNRLSTKVIFYSNKYTYGEWMMRGARFKDLIYQKNKKTKVTYTELEKCLEESTLPEKIQKLL